MERGQEEAFQAVVGSPVQIRLVLEDLLAASMSPAPSALPTCTLAAVPSPRGICKHRAHMCLTMGLSQ